MRPETVPFANLGQDFICLRQRAGGDLAVEFPIRCEGEDDGTIARANRGGLDANLGCGH